MRYITIILALALASCIPLKKQEAKVQHARYGIATTGVATEVADKASREYFEEFPSSDTEKYCQGEVVTLVLEELVNVENLSADAVKLWETAVIIARAKKEAGEDYEPDMDTVLSSEADWLNVAVEVLAVLDFAIQEMRHAGMQIPAVVEYAWDFLYSFTGKPAHGEYEMDWGTLKNGVCKDYLPGGE